MFNRILMVCVGNICRSPTAQFLLQQRLGEGHRSQVSSAGLGALVDHPVDATALEVLREHGVAGEGHRARQLNSSLLRESDLILAMEKSHVTQINRMAPEVSGKVFLLDRWGAGADIPDPYRQQRPAYDHVYEMIERGVGGWLRYL